MTINASKTFRRVYHAGLTHKLKPYGILGLMFDIFQIFSVTDGVE